MLFLILCFTFLVSYAFNDSIIDNKFSNKYLLETNSYFSILLTEYNNNSSKISCSRLSIFFISADLSINFLIYF